MIVGKEYYVSKKDYTKFCMEARSAIISRNFYNSFDKEASNCLLFLQESSMMFDCDKYTWCFSQGLKYFKLKLNIKQEEMDV